MTTTSPFAALVVSLEKLPVKERLTALARLPEVIHAATRAAMAEASASGMTWAQIGEAWGGRSAQAAHVWHQRRRQDQRGGPK